MPKEEPEMTEANACSQCGFDLRLPPECTKERWDAMEAVIAAARSWERANPTEPEHVDNLVAALKRLDGKEK